MRILAYLYMCMRRFREMNAENKSGGLGKQKSNMSSAIVVTDAGDPVRDARRAVAVGRGRSRWWSR